MFPDLGGVLRDGVNRGVENMVLRFGDLFESIANSLLTLLLYLESFLLFLHPGFIIAMVALLGYLASRRMNMALGLAFIAYAIGTLGLWEEAMQTVSITLVALGITILIGVPLGILVARLSTTRIVFMLVLDIMQTIPSFVYLIPATMLFGLGKVPAILATIIYSAPPLIRLTDLGIRSVDSGIIEAACSFGAKRIQILRKVEIPLAMPSIMQGINQSMMMALSMVVIASMIGARGVGEAVLVGLQRNDPGQGFVGGVVIVLLAIIFDRITQAFGKNLQRHKLASEV